MKRVTVCRDGHVSAERVMFCPACGDADELRTELEHEDWCQIHGQFGPPSRALPDGTPADPGMVFVEHLPRICTCGGES